LQGRGRPLIGIENLSKKEAYERERPLLDLLKEDGTALKTKKLA